ncbi:FtsH protease activity modulator HflK [Qiania dongpingensis]|uniref:Protein HflK n=1 Tax=Qiania dongpingensis TaxID=2763669 RepID=A0A7G9G517_9FIRM|nr:FtsH protease activity modulator HflK [Qiania dongpingensis]QNM05899.1 FtsH protease activity modulator HflK [Qiania dongpingensis]
MRSFFETYFNKGPKVVEPDSDGPKKSGKGKKVLKHGKRISVILLAAVAVVVLAFNSTYTINEQEQAVVTTFGVAKSVKESGLHFKVPFVQQVKKVDTTIQGFSVGFDSEGQAVTEEAVMITSDFNFVDIDFYVEYRVSDPVKAVFASEKPVEVLRNLAQSCIRSVVSNYDVDSVLTTGKNEIQSRIKELLLEQLEQKDIGLQLVNITIQDSEPPTLEVLEAFKDVETAKQGKETSINNANKYRNEKLPKAEADVDQILQEAESTKTKRINEAYADVSMFSAQYEEYVKNPLVTKQRMFYETMEAVLPNLKVIIDGTDSTSTMLMDQLSGGATVNQAAAAGSAAGSGTGSSGTDAGASGSDAGTAN